MLENPDIHTQIIDGAGKSPILAATIGAAILWLCAQIGKGFAWVFRGIGKLIGLGITQVLTELIHKTVEPRFSLIDQNQAITNQKIEDLSKKLVTKENILELMESMTKTINSKMK